MKTIKRSIYIDRIKDLDLRNTGVHFTANLAYKHAGGGANGGTNTNAMYRVDIFVKEYEVNEEATLISNTNYPREQEVVLEMNQELTAEVAIWQKSDLSRKLLSRGTETINTGTRADAWVINL